jgi:hypothetical protein
VLIDLQRVAHFFQHGAVVRVGAKLALAFPQFGVSEKRTEREIDIPFIRIMAPKVKKIQFPAV